MKASDNSSAAHLSIEEMPSDSWQEQGSSREGEGWGPESGTVAFRYPRAALVGRHAHRPAQGAGNRPTRFPQTSGCTDPSSEWSTSSACTDE